jgi:hypothetical protein
MGGWDIRMRQRSGMTPERRSAREQCTLIGWRVPNDYGMRPPIPVLRMCDVVATRRFYVDDLGFTLDWQASPAA